MAGVLFTFSSASGEPSLAEAAKKLGVDESALDPKFGVPLIEPRKHLYAVLVDQEHAHDVRIEPGSVDGPFSNPGISDFGPPQPRKKSRDDE